MATMKEVMWAAVQRRAKRLARLVELNGPSYVVTREALMVLEALAGYDGEAYGAAVGTRANEAVRAKFGFCQTCDNPLEPRGNTHCKKCLDENTDDEEEPSL